jgi:CubicO group peptidase (beta-lactamase class C family)
MDLTFACSREQFIKTIASDSPTQLPWATPGYSDLNFMILGAVISKFTAKPLDAIYEDFIFNRLDMSSSYVNAPISGSAFADHSVVVGPTNGSWSFAQNNPTIPSGGLLSSINETSSASPL